MNLGEINALLTISCCQPCAFNNLSETPLLAAVEAPQTMKAESRLIKTNII
jgi:hypothetical protein